MGGLTRSERLVIGAIAFATALAGIGHYAGWTPLLAFGLATVALAGLAHVVSLATEQVGQRMGPAATGLLQSTLGNLPELFVVIFALRAGEVVVAQTSIVGSLFANALLVLGLVIVLGAGSSGDGVMRFRPRLPNDTATLLLVTSFIIVVVGLAHATHEPAANHERAVSTVAAVALLGVYTAWVVPYVRGEAALEPERTEPARVPLVVSVVENSVAQVAAFLYPVLVLISLMFAHQLTFGIAPVLIGALLVTALAVWQITGDGEAVAFDGWALVAIYVILAVFTLYD